VLSTSLPPPSGSWQIEGCQKSAVVRRDREQTSFKIRERSGGQWWLWVARLEKCHSQVELGHAMTQHQHLLCKTKRVAAVLEYLYIASQLLDRLSDKTPHILCSECPISQWLNSHIHLRQLVSPLFCSTEKSVCVRILCWR
jgi:hypothetical protein